jgi:hypothetical protein
MKQHSGKAMPQYRPANSERPPTTKDDQVLGVAGVTAYSQNNVVETAAFRVVVKLALYITGQFPAPLRQTGSERRVVYSSAIP